MLIVEDAQKSKGIRGVINWLRDPKDEMVEMVKEFGVNDLQVNLR